MPMADSSSAPTNSAAVSMIVDTGSGILLEKDTRIVYPESCGIKGILGGLNVMDEVQRGVDCRSRESKKTGLCGLAVPRRSNVCKEVMNREYNASSEDGHCSFRIVYGDGVQSGHIRRVQLRLGLGTENDLEALGVMIGLSTRSMSCSFRHNIAGMDFSKISLLTQLYDRGLIDAYKMGIYDFTGTSTSSNSLPLTHSWEKIQSSAGYMVLGSFEPEWTQDGSNNLMTFPMYRGKEMHAMGSHMDPEFMISVSNMNLSVLDRHIYTVVETIVVGKMLYGKQVGAEQDNGQAMRRFSAIIDTGSTAMRIPKDMYATYVNELTQWARLYGFRVVDQGKLCLVHMENNISTVIIDDAKAAHSFPLIRIILQGNSKSVDISLLQTGDVVTEANRVCLKLEVSKPNNEQIVLGTPFFSHRYVSLDLGKRIGTISGILSAS